MAGESVRQSRRILFYGDYPYGSDKDPFKMIIRPAVEACNYNAVRGDHLNHADKDVAELMLDEIKRADLVALDMTVGSKDLQFIAGYGMAVKTPVLYLLERNARVSSIKISNPWVFVFQLDDRDWIKHTVERFSLLLRDHFQYSMVPASNRIVRKTDNQEHIEQTSEAIDKAIQSIHKSNEHFDEETELAILELELGRRLLEAPQFSAELAQRLLVGSMSMILSKVSDNLVTIAVTSALTAAITLLKAGV